MPASAMQLNAIIERLVAKTQDGSLRWEASLSNNRMQTRLGDYLIQLENQFGPSAGSGYPVSLVISSLNDEAIASTSGPGSLSFNMSGGNISQKHQQMLNQLYQDISNKDYRLDEILKLLK